MALKKSSEPKTEALNMQEAFDQDGDKNIKIADMEASGSTMLKATGAIKKSSLKYKLTNKQRKAITDVFDLFDIEGNRTIETKLLQIAMRALGFQLKKEDIDEMIGELDDEESETITYEEFLYLVTPKVVRRAHERKMKKYLKAVRDGKTSKIPVKNVKRVARDFGVVMEGGVVVKMVEFDDCFGFGEKSQSEILEKMKTKFM